MKKLLLFATVLLIMNGVSAQVLKRLGDRVKQKAEQKAGEKVDKSIDDAVDGKKKDKDSQKSDDSESNEQSNSESNDGANKSGSTPALAFNSKYDFVPGEKVVAYEDFSRADIGDFPTRWNTNGSAEVVTLNNREGKWLKIDKEGVFHPEFITNIPENSTLEFDLGVNNNFDWHNNTFQFFITNLVDPKTYGAGYWQNTYYIHSEMHPYRDGNDHSGKMWIRSDYQGNATLSNDVAVRQWNNLQKNFAHVSLWRQGQRLRIYVNGEKLFDLPKAFDATQAYNAFIFRTYGFHKPTDYYVLGNIRLAVGKPDTRNKLMTEGKFVTRGILFDVNSDKIKPESAGALRDIGNVLKENPSVKVKIVGHTDSDGDDKSNLDLSARRAAAVKTYLVKEYGISADNLESEGKGESQPADKNDTVEGKANNRRVEFIKL